MSSNEPDDDNIRKSDSRHNLGIGVGIMIEKGSSAGGSSKKPVSVGRLNQMTLRNGVGDASIS